MKVYKNTMTKKALEALKRMGESYGFDISKPATNSREAIQWLYFAYLAAIKDQNGAAMSIGRTSTFLDIYFERDLKAGTITEEEVQELIDFLKNHDKVERVNHPSLTTGTEKAAYDKYFPCPMMREP